jgi:hypothetical protein
MAHLEEIIAAAAKVFQTKGSGHAVGILKGSL